MTYRTRYAPSPTGQMHLGHARTALVTWLRARSQGGRLIMRIEDLDPPRVRPGSAESILADHEWLGLGWDEGPFYQSAREQRYAAAFDALRKKGALYPCTCSRREWQAAASSAPHAGEGQPVYPGTCRDGPSHPERPASWRFRLGHKDAADTQGLHEAPGFRDELHGSVPPAPEGDFLVRRSDDLWAYQLAVVVDDHEMGVTEVIRGDDLLGATRLQIALYEALGRSPPAWLHVPLVLGEDGVRLAKRHGAIAIRDYRDAGWSRARLLGLLAHSLGLTDRPGPVDLATLRGRFEVARLRRDPARLPPP